MVVVVVEALISRQARDEEVATIMMRERREERRRRGEGAGAGKCGCGCVLGVRASQKASSFVAALVRSGQARLGQDLVWGQTRPLLPSLLLIRFASFATYGYASVSQST